MMAKLEDVKTLDMVNGEITKVAYGGVAYERVEGEAKAGDIALAIKRAEDTTLGNFYPVTDTSHGDIMYMDDVDDEQVNPPECFRIFHKVAVATNPSVEERVAKAEGEIESLKSDVAALKGEAEYKRIGKSEARAGDYVKFIETDDSSLTVGKMYEIVNIDYEGYLDFIDDDGDKNCGVSSEVFEVYRKVSAAEPKPERLKVGDYARVVEDQTTSDDDPIGDEACVGDYVEVLTVDKSDIPFEVRIITGKKVGDTAWAREFALVRATDEEVAEAKRAAKWAEIGREVGEYKVGDIFRSLGGNLFEINRIDDRSPYPIRFTNLKGDDDGYKRDAAITLVTPVEARFDR